MDELKEIITCVLDQKGVIHKLKAELRANVFLAVDEQDRRHGIQGGIAARSDCNKRDALYATRDGALLVELIQDFLSWADMRFTAKVFEAEMNHEGVQPDRHRLAGSLGLGDVIHNDQPLLMLVLHAAMEGLAHQPIAAPYIWPQQQSPVQQAMSSLKQWGHVRSPEEGEAQEQGEEGYEEEEEEEGMRLQHARRLVGAPSAGAGAPIFDRAARGEGAQGTDDLLSSGGRVSDSGGVAGLMRFISTSRGASTGEEACAEQRGALTGRSSGGVAGDIPYVMDEEWRFGRELGRMAQLQQLQQAEGQQQAGREAAPHSELQQPAQQLLPLQQEHAGGVQQRQHWQSPPQEQQDLQQPTPLGVEGSCSFELGGAAEGPDGWEAAEQVHWQHAPDVVGQHSAASMDEDFEQPRGSSSLLEVPALQQHGGNEEKEEQMQQGGEEEEEKEGMEEQQQQQQRMPMRLAPLRAVGQLGPLPALKGLPAKQANVGMAEVGADEPPPDLRRSRGEPEGLRGAALVVQQMKQQQSQQAHQQQLWQQQQQHQVAAMAAVAPFKLSAEREPVFESGSAGQAGAHPPGTAWGNIGPQRAQQQQQQQQADSSRAKYAVYKAGAAETVLVVGDEEEELPEESFDELQGEESSQLFTVLRGPPVTGSLELPTVGARQGRGSRVSQEVHAAELTLSLSSSGGEEEEEEGEGNASGIRAALTAFEDVDSAVRDEADEEDEF